jgi:hypothetical protein
VSSALERIGGAGEGSRAASGIPNQSQHERLIEAAARRLLEQLKGLEGVAILAPCGCSRAELLKLLMKPGEQAFSKAYAHRGFREKAEAIQDAERATLARVYALAECFKSCSTSIRFLCQAL